MLLQATPYYEEVSLARLANIPYQNEHIRPELLQAIDIASIAPTIPPIESSVTRNEQASEEWHFSED
jgi:hypothetical protein